MTARPQASVFDGAVARYIARETTISAAINAAISLAFFLVVFGVGNDVAVWGLGNYAFDFLPQSFAVTFFASLVPSLLARRAILSGRLGGSSGEVAGFPTMLVRSILFGIAGMALGAGLGAGLLWLPGVQAIGFIPAICLKIAYGAALGAFVTRRCLASMLVKS